MKTNQSMSPAAAVALGDGELISMGEEILTRAHVLGQALRRRVLQAVPPSPSEIAVRIEPPAQQGAQ